MQYGKAPHDGFQPLAVLIENTSLRYAFELKRRWGSRRGWIEHCGQSLDSTPWPIAENITRLLRARSTLAIQTQTDWYACVGFLLWTGIGPWTLVKALVPLRSTHVRSVRHPIMNTNEVLEIIAVHTAAVKVLYECADVWEIRSSKDTHPAFLSACERITAESWD